MAGFVLHFGQQDGLAFEGRGSGDPVAFRQHSHNFGVGVLGNLTDEGAAVFLRHPILRFYFLFGLDVLQEFRVVVFAFHHLGLWGKLT